eukprot:jgi/Mesen1/6744/ME000344S06023
MAAIAASSIAVASLSAPVEIGNVSTKAARALTTPKMACKVSKASLTVCAQQSEETQSRRSAISLFAATIAAGAFAGDALAEATKVKLEGPPPLSGGLPGTESADQARDTDAPLKERFYLQPQDPAGALARAKESAEAIVGVKSLIERKAWPYVQNELRSKAGYLRFDLNTVIGSKPKSDKKALTSLANQLYDSIAALDYAARVKSVPDATKNYDNTVSLLKDVLAKLA